MTGNFIRIFGWSIYLCCSWMWCIGIFYPVLLYRDFGMTAWFIFAISNIVGAALVPWFIRNSQESESFIHNHAFACQVFSFITILFQIYFLSWIIASFQLSIMTIVLIALIFFVGLISCTKRILTVSSIVFFTSLCILLFISIFERETGLLIVREGKYGAIETLGLIPVFLIGFFFCPYLDLTFHRVIKELRQPQIKPTYVVGFFILFLSFLVLGIKYLPIIYHVLLGSNNQLKGSIIISVCAYVVIQTSFTSIVHLNELLKLKLSRSIWILFICFSVCVSLYAIFADSEIFLLGQSMHLREILFRGFLSVYGLLAPAYIWVFAVVKFGEPQRCINNYWKWVIWSVSVFLALPFYIVGFFGNFKLIPYVLPLGVLTILFVPYVALCLFPVTKQVSIKA